ncbi:MAG: methyl-accepting chemotaxis protein [Bacteroidota bacterium]
MNLSIINRIIWGAVIVMSVVFILVYANYSGLIKSQSTVDRIAEERSPTVQATLKMFNGINRSMDGLRGYVFLNDDKYQAIRTHAWSSFIEEARTEMDQLSLNWSNPENVDKYNEVKSLLPLFLESQLEAENLSKAGNRNEALNVIMDKVTPKSNQLSSILEEIYQSQQMTLNSDLAELSSISSTTGNRAVILGILSGVVCFAIIIFIVISIKNRILTPVDNMQQNMKDVSEGDLTTEVFVKEGIELTDAAKGLKMMIAKIKEILTTVQQASNQIADASTEMTGSSQQMSEGATEQASSVEEISSSMEEMAAGIQQNTDNAKQTEKTSVAAAGSILESSASVNKTVESMISIADKISIIGEISRQTNLLALNAAVEAARAGEHGKGFAVVAGEIRRLAERSQTAATEIDDLSKDSVTIAQKSGKMLESAVPRIQKNSELVGEITAASIEQNSGVDQINTAIQQLNQVVQQNAAVAEEMAASAEQLNAQADLLKDAIAYFRVDENGVEQPDEDKYLATPAPVKKTEKSSGQSSKGVDIDLGMSNEGLDSEYEKF